MDNNNDNKMRKTSTEGRPDMTLDGVGEKIWMVGMSCSQENIEEETETKLQKYQPIAFKTREKRPGYGVGWYQLYHRVSRWCCGENGQNGDKID